MLSQIVLLVSGAVFTAATTKENFPDDKVHAKTVYLSALIDRSHLDLRQEWTWEHQDNGDYLDEEKVKKMLKKHLKNTIKKHRQLLKELAEITEDKGKSAKEINKHFAKDHLKPIILEAVDKKNPPDFVDSLAKKLSAYSRKRINRIFGIK